jgi:hypothetical protein
MHFKLKICCNWDIWGRITSVIRELGRARFTSCSFCCQMQLGAFRLFCFLKSLFTFVAGKVCWILNAESTVRVGLYESSHCMHERVLRKDTDIFVGVFYVTAKLIVIMETSCVSEPYLNDLQA